MSADPPAHPRRLGGDFLAAPVGPGPDGLRGLATNGDGRVVPAALADPRRGEDAAAFRCADGPVNLHHFPRRPEHRDFVAGVEDPASPLGRTAVVRPDQGDLVRSQRHARARPVTMQWHSNGGQHLGLAAGAVAPRATADRGV